MLQISLFMLFSLVLANKANKVIKFDFLQVFAITLKIRNTLLILGLAIPKDVSITAVNERREASLLEPHKTSEV